MQVETTIQRMLDNFPMLFSNRQECYDHLFCVIGNGYRWWHGQLVKDDPFYYEPSVRKVLLQFNDDDYKRKVPRAKQTDENIRKKQKRDAEVLAWLEERKKHGATPDTSEKWYPLYREARIYHVPRNAKPDWKRAAEECKAMLIHDGVWKEYEEAE